MNYSSIKTTIKPYIYTTEKYVKPTFYTPARLSGFTVIALVIIGCITAIVYTHFSKKNNLKKQELQLELELKDDYDEIDFLMEESNLSYNGKLVIHSDNDTDTDDKSNCSD